MKAADEVGLDVYARIGYTWDYYNDAHEYIVDRFFGLLCDKKVIDAWYAYVSKMYDTLSQYDTISCGESSFTATMYGIPTGLENVGERVFIFRWHGKTQYILSQLQQQNENKAIYVEQFLSADNTLEYAHNAQIHHYVFAFSLKFRYLDWVE